jgi:hypothetical protein
MSNADRYIKAWRKYKNSKRIFIALFVGFYPVLEWVVRPIYQQFNNDWIIHGYALTWIILFFIFFAKVLDFDCPRCGKSFSEKWYGVLIGYVGFRMNKCVHCGLPKWSLGDSGEFYNNS